MTLLNELTESASQFVRGQLARGQMLPNSPELTAELLAKAIIDAADTCQLAETETAVTATLNGNGVRDLIVCAIANLWTKNIR